MYNNQRSSNYQDQVGFSILNIASITPQGLLVFVSSYSAMDMLICRWKMTELYEKISQVKDLFVEPRKPNKGALDKLLKSYCLSCETLKGAILLCVQRGKMSEGIDFAGIYLYFLHNLSIISQIVKLGPSYVLEFHFLQSKTLRSNKRKTITHHFVIHEDY